MQQDEVLDRASHTEELNNFQRDFALMSRLWPWVHACVCMLQAVNSASRMRAFVQKAPFVQLRVFSCVASKSHEHSFSCVQLPCFSVWPAMDNI